MRGWLRDLAPPCGALATFYLVAGLHGPLGSATRYYLAAREMAAPGGDWIAPHLNGVPYFEKPPLAYWVGALGQRLLGEGALALHLPALLGCLLLVAAARWAGGLLSPATGRAAAWLTAGSGMVLGLSTIYLTDQLFAGVLALAWCAYAMHDREAAPSPDSQPGPLRWRWLFWALIGVAWLAKGPLALVLSGCAVGGHLLLKGGPGCAWRGGWRLAPVRGLLLMLAVIAPWHLAVWMHDPRGLEMFYVTINLRGFFDPTVNHPGPKWFYLPIVPGAWTPWVLPLAPLLALGLWTPLCEAWSRCAAAMRSRRWWDWPQPVDGGERLLLVALIIFPLVFLSISSSKLAYYVLPFWPALAVLAADRLLPLLAAPPVWLRRALTAQVVLLAIGGVVFAIARGAKGLPHRVDWSHGGVVVAAALVLVVGMLWGAIACWRGRMRHGLVAAGIAQALAVALAFSHAGELMDASEAGPLAAAMGDRIAPADRVILGPGAAHEHGVPWVLHRDTELMSPPRELGMGLFTTATPPSTPLPRDPYTITPADLPQQPRLVAADDLARDWPGQRRIWLVCEPLSPGDLRQRKNPSPWQRFLAGRPALWLAGGNNGYWLVTNQAIAGAVAWNP